MPERRRCESKGQRGEGRMTVSGIVKAFTVGKAKAQAIQGMDMDMAFWVRTFSVA